MHHTLRSVAAWGCLGLLTVFGLHGCSGRLGPVRATQSAGSTEHANLPDVTVEQTKECVAFDGRQLEKGRIVLESTVDVNKDGDKVGVTVSGIPETARDFGICIRKVLESIPLATQSLHDAVKILEFSRKHAGDSPDALERFIEVIPGVPIVESELVLEADGYTVVLPVTVKVRAKLEELIDIDDATLKKIGQMALDTLGYDEIMRRAKQVGWLETVRKTQAKVPADKGLISQTETEVVVVMFEVFTTHAVTAGVVSQLDSPLPGPADLAAIGIMAIGLYKVGAVAINALTTATAPTPTASPPPPPPPPPRRHPSQTCENDELDRLEAKKEKICKPEEGFATICPKDPLKKKAYAQIPCSLIKLSLLQRQTCVAARWEVQNKCFGGKPDPEHKDQIDQVQNGVNNCEGFKLINCAQGHPMANL